MSSDDPPLLPPSPHVPQSHEPTPPPLPQSMPSPPHSLPPALDEDSEAFEGLSPISGKKDSSVSYADESKGGIPMDPYFKDQQALVKTLENTYSRINQILEWKRANHKKASLFYCRFYHFFMVFSIVTCVVVACSSAVFDDITSYEIFVTVTNGINAVVLSTIAFMKLQSNMDAHFRASEKSDKLYMQHVFQKGRHWFISEDLEVVGQILNERIAESRKHLDDMIQEYPAVPDWISNPMLPDTQTPTEETFHYSEFDNKQTRHDPPYVDERVVDEFARGLNYNGLVESKVDELIDDIRSFNEDIGRIDSPHRLLNISSKKIEMDDRIAELRNLRYLDNSLAGMRYFTEVYDIENEVKHRMEHVEALGKHQDHNNQVHGHTKSLISQLEENITRVESLESPDEDDIVRLREHWEVITGVRLHNNLPALPESEAAELRARLVRCFEKAQSQSSHDRNVDPWVYASSLVARAAKPAENKASPRSSTASSPQARQHPWDGLRQF